MLAFTHLSAELLNETATRVKSGELAGFDTLGALIALAAFVNAVDEGFAEVTPPELLVSSYEDALAVHNQIKDIFARWWDDQIDAAAVLQEMEPVLQAIDQTARTAEEILAREYGQDPDELTRIRQELIDSIPDIFATPEPGE